MATVILKKGEGRTIKPAEPGFTIMKSMRSMGITKTEISFM